MNEELLLECNIMNICYETVSINATKRINQIIPNVINFFVKYVIHSTNLYHAVFVKTKLQNLIKCSELPNEDIKRKLLVEIYVYLSICNKPIHNKNISKTKKIKLKEDVENILINELKTYRKQNIIESCLDVLIKSNITFVWDICREFSEIPEYVNTMEELYGMCRRKELVFDAFAKLDKHGLKYSNSDYTNIILQCMMKINYIYYEKDLFDKHMEVYIKCLNCPLEKLTDTFHSIQYNKDMYTYSDSRKSVVITPNKQQEHVYFEKTMTNK